MAKSKSFFGVRKGSTKSHTYSVYHGQQITKDRWTQVKNPQTDAQMRQRMIVKMVANMRSQLKDTLQNTFEGLSGQEALRKFTSENCKKGAITPISWVKKDEMSAGVADYIVSQGTLEPTKTMMVGDVQYHAYNTNYIPDTQEYEEVGGNHPLSEYPNIAQSLMKGLGCAENDTLIFVYQETQNQTSNYATTENLNYHSNTITFNNDGLKQWEVTEYAFEEFIQIQKYGTTKPITIEFDEVDENECPIYIESTNSQRVTNFAIVHVSENKISTERILLTEPIQEITYEEAKATYMDAKNTGKSDKYLNNGGSGVDIAGGGN